MFASSCCYLLRTTNFTSPALPILGICLALFASNSLSAWGQVPQNSFQSSGYLESLQYHAPLGETNLVFFEFSGVQDNDDPLENFFDYLNDPINWDLSGSSIPRTIYRTQTGIQSHKNFLNGTSRIRFGLETVMEHARVQSIPRSNLSQAHYEQHHHLVDAAITPYFHLDFQPLSWIRMNGNLKLNILTFDIQNACPQTCSLEPRGQGNTTVPSFKGSLQIGPWLNTQLVIDFGTGFYRFDDREPLGSTGEQQINQTRFLQLGFLTSPGSQIEIRGSFWAIKNNTDYSYNLEQEEFLNQGPSQRYGFNLEGTIGLTKHMTLTGGATISRSSFQDLQQPFPLTPRVIGRASLHTDWDQYWSTILQWQYIGKRKTRNQSLPAIHNVDMFFHYQYPMGEKYGNLQASLGIINVRNHQSPYSVFAFDSDLTTNPTDTIDLNHYPGQPRTIVGGISWFF